MIINKNLFKLAVAAAAASVAIGCTQPGATNTNTSTNSNAVLTSNSATNANSAVPNANASTGSTSTSSNAADSPSAAYQAAYTARKNKDVAGLKKLFSKDVLEFLTMLGEADPKKKQTLDDMLKDLCEQPQAATAETRNEKISGDKATVEYLDEKGGWETMDFVKEDGIWKLTIDKPEGGTDEKDTGKKK